MPFTKETKSSHMYSRVTHSAASGHAPTKLDVNFTLTSSRTADPVVGHKSIIKNGGSATGALTAFRQTCKIQEGTCTFTFTDGVKVTNINYGPLVPGFVMPGNLVPTDVVDAAVADATAQAYKKIREKQTPFEGQTFLAELKETIQMLRHPFQGMAKLTDSVLNSRKSGQKLSQAGKGTSSQWLEFQYGIIPLISDTVAILELLDVLAKKEARDTFRVYGQHEKQIELYVVPDASTGTTGVNCHFERLISAKAENIVRIGLDASVIESAKWTNNSLIDSVDDISSIPITAWEMIPWSFLIDYFVNIGDIIGSVVTSQHGVSYISNSVIKTYTQKSTIASPTISRPDLILSIDSSSPHVITSQMREVTRSGTLGAIPPLVFSLPGSNTRYANIAALVAQSLLR